MTEEAGQPGKSGEKTAQGPLAGISSSQERRRLSSSYDLHVRIPLPLIEDVRKIYPQLGVAAITRLALATLAGWPDGAVKVVGSDYRC